MLRACLKLQKVYKEKSIYRFYVRSKVYLKILNVYKEKQNILLFMCIFI